MENKPQKMGWKPRENEWAIRLTVKVVPWDNLLPLAPHCCPQDDIIYTSGF